MAKRLAFLFDSSVDAWGADLERIRSMLAVVADQGIECELIDTGSMADEELDKWRHQATAIAVWQHQAIRQAFGSRRQGGLPYFGRQVPALLVYKSGERSPVAVYPHSETRGDTRTDFTIEGYLKGLLGCVEDGQ